MLKICSIILLFNVLLISKQRLFTKANECPTYYECKHISQCDAVLSQFHLITRKPYCNDHLNSTYVCCLMPELKYTQEKDEGIRSVRECKALQRLRPSCEKSLISGGKKAAPKEFPFMALLYVQEGNTKRWMCGGTLISNKFVLTAAHCFYDDEIEPNMVRLGELDYSTTTDDAFPKDFSILQTYVHPEYFVTEYKTNYNDIAVSELSSKVQFNEYIMPACLPLVDGREFQEYKAAGWGRTNSTARDASSHLMKVKLDRFDDETCFNKVKKTELLTFGVNNRTQMCAGSHNDTRDTCPGDSGGPLFVDHPDNDYKCLFVVVGITSYADGGCGIAGNPGVYTRVTQYLNWIEHIVWKEPVKLS